MNEVYFYYLLIPILIYELLVLIFLLISYHLIFYLNNIIFLLSFSIPYSVHSCSLIIYCIITLVFLYYIVVIDLYICYG